MRSGEEIQAALRSFVSRWDGYRGSERGEAQTFLNELFECFGRDRKEAGAEFEDSRTSLGIMDLHLPGVVIVEMKAPSEAGRLEAHRDQALRYWRESASVAAGRPAPPYVVLCAFNSSRSGSRASTQPCRGRASPSPRLTDRARFCAAELVPTSPARWPRLRWSCARRNQ